ncbi:MAG TPA: XRE family transcriptional regulator [Chloroflexi bacterium]|nr:XRE family transcriptional regulator [Chloroflexota bacterium]
MSEQSTFGQWIKRLRAARDLTQEQLAEEAACAVQTVRSFESGARRPSREMAERLADILQVPDAFRAQFIDLARRRTDADAVPAAPTATAVNPEDAPRFRPALPLTTLIGRQTELIELTQLLTVGPTRLVTLVGPGGMGKSRLAGQLAHDLADHFAHGALWISLAAVSQIDAIPALIAEAMGEQLRGAALPTTQVRALLAERNLLLVLDNFEHLLDVSLADRAIELIEQILLFAPEVRLLITSRERLRLQVERIYTVDGLSTPRLRRAASISPEEAAGFDAVILFLERARQVDRQFALNATNSGDVARVCALLQGMPLGIELAAAWVRMLTPREIADEIAGSIDFLAVADRKTALRHRSIRAVFDHSWEMLEACERQQLARLAIFRGSFDRSAAQAVAGVSLPGLVALVDKSLVRATTAGNTAARYDLHELLRRYLLDKLELAGELDAIEALRLQYYSAFAQQHAPSLLEGDARQRLASLEPEQANLRAALEWSLGQRRDPATGAQLAATLGRHWYHTEQWREGREWLLQAAPHVANEPLTEALIHTNLAELSHSLSEHREAVASFECAIARWRQLKRPDELAWTLVQAGALANTMGRFETAAAYFDEALGHYRQAQNEVRIAVVLSHSASAAISRSRYEEAVRLASEALVRFRELNRQENLAIALNLLGRARLGLGETAPAIELFQEALALSQRRGSKAGVMWASLNLGLTYALEGEFASAGVHYQLALDGYINLGKRGGILAVIDGLAAVGVGCGCPVEGVELLAFTTQHRQEIDEQLTPQEEMMRQRAFDHSHLLLDPHTWESAWQCGGAFTIERGVAQARALMRSLDARGVLQ